MTTTLVCARFSVPKLDLILARLHLRERVKDELVAIKMHTGTGIGYSTVHPIFIRKVVQAIEDGGGKPFITDVNCHASGQSNPRQPANLTNPGILDNMPVNHRR